MRRLWRSRTFNRRVRPLAAVAMVIGVIAVVGSVAAGCGSPGSTGTIQVTSSNTGSTTGAVSVSSQPTTGPQTTMAQANGDQTTGTQPASGSQTSTTQAAVAAEKNPPGDIPDSQAFVAYESVAGKFSVAVPEGWARTTSPASVVFTDKLNAVAIDWQASASMPSLAEAKTTEVPALAQTIPAFKLVGVEESTLPAGHAVLIRYQMNSVANPVTGKQYRLDALRFEVYKSGVRVNLTLSSPAGADNVDPWNTVSRSLKWL